MENTIRCYMCGKEHKESDWTYDIYDETKQKWFTFCNQICFENHEKMRENDKFLHVMH